ncbi:hypothetical protein DAI22_02g216650 [Oryza sativa Japonica Group]|nr:hypothetical protein DAI22_02g216650 [Oryza sativa Japonica Group]
MLPFRRKEQACNQTPESTKKISKPHITIPEPLKNFQPSNAKIWNIPAETGGHPGTTSSLISSPPPTRGRTQPDTSREGREGMPHLVRTRARAGGLASPPSGEVPGGGGGGERASAFFGGGSMVGWGGGGD